MEDTLKIFVCDTFLVDPEPEKPVFEMVKFLKWSDTEEQYVETSYFVELYGARAPSDFQVAFYDNKAMSVSL